MYSRIYHYLSKGMQALVSLIKTNSNALELRYARPLFSLGLHRRTCLVGQNTPPPPITFQSRQLVWQAIDRTELDLYLVIKED